jgi:hypothetical protein
MDERAQFNQPFDSAAIVVQEGSERLACFAPITSRFTGPV